MTQTIKLRPMSETPERWPVYVSDTKCRRPGLLEIYYSQSDLLKPSWEAITRDGVGWLYADELKFEVGE